MRTTTLFPATAVLALGASAVLAHHSGYMYQTTPVWISGTVVGFERIDPHTIMTLEERREDGELRRWAVEGLGRTQLDRRGAGLRVPQAGDTLELCVFAYKPLAELARIFPELDVANGRSTALAADASPRLVAGHVIVSADGRKQLWEPHGILSECIRSSDDDRRAWVDFLESSSSAMAAWCQQKAYEHVRSTAALQEVVAEIDAALGEGC